MKRSVQGVLGFEAFLGRSEVDSRCAGVDSRCARGDSKCFGF